MDWLLQAVFAPGFFSSQPVRIAMIVGGAAAIVSGVVGVFAVMRGQSFAGHSLADISSAGGSAAFLVGANPLLGFVAMALLGGAGMEAFRVRQLRERDLVTGVVTGAGLGLSALLLYLSVTTTSTRGAAITVMFGSMFSISQAIMPLAVAIGAAALLLVALLYRPLLLSSLDAELAAVQGVPVRLIETLFLMMLALAVSLSAITVGAILSTALLVGPAATALRLASRPGRALLLAPVVGLVATFGGILIAYDSYGWTGGRGWPVSFCIVALTFLFYLATSLPRGFGVAVLAIDVEV
ncbi:MAG TPA: metal ABC transporter permease [Devosia sp.]|nr:metal ABC transporter permease [Devosia sp.]